MGTGDLGNLFADVDTGCDPFVDHGGFGERIPVEGISRPAEHRSILLPPTPRCHRPSRGERVAQFQTQVTSGDNSPFSFDVFGDWGQVDSNGNNQDMANLFSQVAASGARFALTVGDNGYPNGSQINYGDLQQKGADTSAIFGPSFWSVAGSTIPLFTAAGNHGLSGSTHTDITTWTQDSAVSTSGGRYQGDSYCCVNGSATANYASEWYAFDAGPARFYLLDSAWGDTNSGNASPYANDAAAHFTPGTPEYDWLQNDLQTHPSGLKFAFSHYPFYSDNPTQGSDTSLQGTSNLEGLLGQYGVKIVFNGHAHLYERNNASAPGMPITYVTGGGGGLPEPVGPCHSYDAYGIGWSPTKLKGSACGSAQPPPAASNVFHFLKVTVSGTTVTVAPTDELGRTFDVQTYSFGGTTLPDTVVDSQPNTPTNATTAAFTFHSTVTPATFACSLDGAAATSCTSPVSYTGLAGAAHTFRVTATTTTGSDPTPAVANWTIDTTLPTVPAGLVGSAGSPTLVNLTWNASTDSSGIAGYDVARNGTTIGSVGAATTSYTDTTASPSTTYQYSVRARDNAGNASDFSTPASVTTPASGSGASLVQSAGSSTATVTFGVPSTPGDLLVLSASVFTGLSKPITAVSDGQNTWTKVGAFAVSGQNSDGEMWYSPNAASVSSITVTTGATTVALKASEFSGVAATSPLEGSAGAANTGTTANSGSATPASSNDLAVGFVAGHSNAQAIGVSSAGYIVQSQQTATSPSIATVVTGYQPLGAPNAQSFAGTFPAGMYWSSGVAFFRTSGGTPPPPPNDFSMVAAPSSVTVTAGQSGSSSVSTTVTSGVAQTVALSVSGLPAGASASFSPASITSGQSSTLSVVTSASTPVGTTSLTVTGTGASATHTTPLSLTVNAPSSNDFSMVAAPSSVTVTAGQSGSSSVSTTVTSGVAQTVALSVSGLPAGASASFSPASITSGQSSTLSVVTSASTPVGTTSLTVTGTGASATHTTPLSLTVNAPSSNDFSMVAAPSSVTVTAGQSGSSSVSTTVTSGVAQTVALSVSGLPAGASASFSPASITSGQSSTLSVVTSASTPVGTTSLTVTGTGASATHTTPLSLTVTPIATSAPALAQSTGATETTTATSLVATFTNPTTAGNLLVLSASVYTGATNHITSITDSAGNTWTRIGAFSVASHNSDGEMWFSANAASVTSVTAHLGAAATMALGVQEFSGLAPTPLDVAAGTAGTSTAAASGPATATGANELAVGFVTGHANAQTMTVTSAGYTALPQRTSTGTIASVVTGYKVLGAGSGESFTASFGTAMYWATGIAIFRPAS